MNKFVSTITAALIAVFTLTTSAYAANAADSGNFQNCTPQGEPGSIELQTMKPNVLTVAVTLPIPGFWNGTSPENITGGFGYCMAAEIAHRAGISQIDVKNLAWPQFISGTVMSFDIAVTATTITSARKEVFDFSVPYFSSGLGVAIRAGSNVNEDNLRSKRIGVLQGNFGASWVVHKLKPKVTPRIFQNQPDMFAALKAGLVDAVVTDTTLALSATKASDGALTVVGRFDVGQGYGVVMPPDTPNLAAINKVVKEMKSDGTLDRLEKKFLKPMFGVSPTSIDVWTVK